MDNQHLALKPFMDMVDDALQKIDGQQLKKNLLEYAQDLPANQRLEFFQFLAFQDEQTETHDYLRDESLLEDIKMFYAEIESGNYDHEIDHTASKENLPMWVDDIDILFDRTNDAFYNNDHQYTEECYHILFEALNIAEDIALDHQLYSAQEIIITDVTEAKARYFRSVYDSHTASVGSQHLFEAIKKFLAIGSRYVGLKAISESSTEELANYDKFLKDWIAILKSIQNKDNESFENLRRWLLREAVSIQKGHLGLEELAEEEGHSHPETYYELIECYITEGNLKGAERAALNGIEQIKDEKKKAVLEDWLAELAHKDNDFELEIDSRKKAWRLAPTQERLVHWCTTLKSAPSDAQLTEEIKFLRENYPTQVRLICMLELLAGEYHIPRRALLVADPLGWSPVSHPGLIVYPFLLLGASGVHNVPEGTSLQSICEDMKSIFIRWQADIIHDMGDEDYPVDTFLDYLIPAIEKHPPSEEDKELFLITARTVLLDRLHIIIQKRLTHAYERNARLVIAFAETCFLMNQKQRGLDLILQLRTEYIKNTLFRSEVRTLFNESPILPHMNKLGQFTEYQESH